MNVAARWSGRVLALLMAVVLGLLSGGVAAADDPAPAVSPAAGTEIKTGQWTWTGPKTGNEHWVHVPENYDPSKPCPLILMSHGVSSSGAAMIKAGTCSQAVRRGWIAVAPTWRYDGHTDLDSAKVADEIIDLIKKLVAEYNIDRSTIVSSGYSGGGGVSIKCFTKYPDVFTFLASQASNFYGGTSPHVKLPGPDRRPVLVLWGETDHPLILDQGPKERDYFTRKGNPTTSYMVPGGKHRPFPTHTWAWLDAMVMVRTGEELDAALKAAAKLRGPGSESKIAGLLAPFQGRAAATEKPVAGDADPFIKEWQEKYNATVKGLAEKLAKAVELYQAAIGEGRKQLDLMVPKFTPESKMSNIRWMRTFKARWAGAAELCQAADDAYEKAYGEKLPEAVKR